MDFQPDHDFPIAGGALDELRGFDRCVHGALLLRPRAEKTPAADSPSISGAKPLQNGYAAHRLAANARNTGLARSESRPAAIRSSTWLAGR